MNALEEAFRREIIKKGGLGILIRQSTGRSIGNPVIETIEQYLNIESDEDRRDFYNYAFYRELEKRGLISLDELNESYMNPLQERYGNVWYVSAKYLIMYLEEGDPEDERKFIEKLRREEELDFSILDKRYERFRLFIRQLATCYLLCRFRKKCIELAS